MCLVLLVSLLRRLFCRCELHAAPSPEVWAAPPALERDLCERRGAITVAMATLMRDSDGNLDTVRRLRHIGKWWLREAWKEKRGVAAA